MWREGVTECVIPGSVVPNMAIRGYTFMRVGHEDVPLSTPYMEIHDMGKSSSFVNMYSHTLEMEQGASMPGMRDCIVD